MALPQPYPLFDKVVFGEPVSKLISINLGILILSLGLIAVTFFINDKYSLSHSFLTKSNRILLWITTKTAWISFTALVCFIVAAASPITKQANKTIPQVYRARVMKPNTHPSANFGLHNTATDKIETVRLQLIIGANTPDKKWASLKKPSFSEFIGVDTQPRIDLRVITIGEDGITVVDADRNIHPYLVRSLLQDDFKKGDYYTISRKVLGEPLYRKLRLTMKEDNPYHL